MSSKKELYLLTISGEDRRTILGTIDVAKLHIMNHYNDKEILLSLGEEKNWNCNEHTKMWQWTNGEVLVQHVDFDMTRKK